MVSSHKQPGTAHDALKRSVSRCEWKNCDGAERRGEKFLRPRSGDRLPQPICRSLTYRLLVNRPIAGRESPPPVRECSDSCVQAPLAERGTSNHGTGMPVRVVACGGFGSWGIAAA